MSEAKFTKGPWYRANYSARSSATGKFLAHTDSNSLEESERIANASLIAAAPEMYEMLQKAADELLFMIRKANSDLIQSVTSSDENEPEYYYEQTVFEIMEILAKSRGEK